MSPTPQFKRLTPQLSVSAALSVADLDAVVNAGFRSVVCNRPDGEAAGQADFSALQAAAAARGVQMRHLPAESGKVTAEHGAAFAELVRELPGPVLAFCRSGLRSTTMWAKSQRGSLSRDEILAIAAQAGFDLRAAV